MTQAWSRLISNIPVDARAILVKTLMACCSFRWNLNYFSGNIKCISAQSSLHCISPIVLANLLSLALSSLCKRKLFWSLTSTDKVLIQFSKPILWAGEIFPFEESIFLGSLPLICSAPTLHCSILLYKRCYCYEMVWKLLRCSSVMILEDTPLTLASSGNTANLSQLRQNIGGRQKRVIMWN